MTLKGTTAIVVGASRGIGKEISLALAKEGAAIVAAGRTLSSRDGVSGSLEETAREIIEAGGQAKAVQCDITREDQVNRLVRETLESFSRIDILVNNAGVFPDMHLNLVDMPVESWDLTFQVNLRGPFLCIKAALPSMMQNRKGSIINLTSIAGIRTPGGRIAYGASKAALDRLTYGLSQEVKPFHIAVNALCPIALADTPGARKQFPGENFAQWVRAADVARAAVWLAQQDATTFTGRAVTVPNQGRFTMLVYGRASDERMFISLD